MTAQLIDVRACLERGQFRKALALLESSRQHLPGDNVSQENLELALQAYNRIQWLPEAKIIVDSFNREDNLHPDARLEVALFHVLTGNHALAESSFRQALKANPKSRLFASELAIVYEQRGETKKAQDLYEKILADAIKQEGWDAIAARVLSRLTGLRALKSEELKAVRSAAVRNKGLSLEPRLWFALARHYLRENSIKNEIECLERANKLSEKEYLESGQAYSVDFVANQTQKLLSTYTRKKPDWMPDFEPSEKRVIFILGMPRSGTTLLEQILGTHSEIGNSGESRAMNVAMQRFSGVGKLKKAGALTPFKHHRMMKAADYHSIAEYYLRYQHLLTTETVVTDKELSNITRVGLLANLFPGASFIFVKRQPLDVAVSLLQHDLANAPYSTNAVNALVEYENYYARAEHWALLFPEQVFNLEYESLVTEPEKNLKKLFSKIGLPWEEAVLNFYQRSNSVRTPSLSQVRSGLTTNAIEKWKSYKPLLTQAIQYLNR